MNEGFGDNFEYYSRLECSNFSEQINPEYTDQILSQIKSQAKSYSPVFSEHIGSNRVEKNCKTWDDILQLLIDSLLFCYREEQHRALVIKEVWTLEIAYSLLERFKDRVKIIAILRDPADIVSSSKTNAGNYPLLYLVRHWRKNIAIARHLKQEHPAQVHLLGYEELCENLKKYRNDWPHIAD